MAEVRIFDDGSNDGIVDDDVNDGDVVVRIFFSFTRRKVAECCSICGTFCFGWGVTPYRHPGAMSLLRFSFCDDCMSVTDGRRQPPKELWRC
jgi:hypothetical protein